ncbi:MAG: hypothetical protein AAF770_00945 [Bacteroidota bacterium]
MKAVENNLKAHSSPQRKAAIQAVHITQEANEERVKKQKSSNNDKDKMAS